MKVSDAAIYANRDNDPSSQEYAWLLMARTHARITFANVTASEIHKRFGEEAPSVASVVAIYSALLIAEAAP